MKVDINVPESLNEITLYQYQKFEKLIQNNEASHFVNQKTIEIFCDIELKDVARIKVADTDSLLVHLNTLLQTKPKLTRTFKLGIYEFGFIPKIEDITSGEFIDLETYLGDTETLHKAMAVLFRPIKNKVKDLYIIEDYEAADKYSEVLKYMPLDIALGSMLFFWTLLNDCGNALSHYIQNEVEQSEAAKQVLEKNGVGINQFTQQLKGIFSDSIQLPNYPSQL
jgi:dynactin complex subunit